MEFQAVVMAAGKGSRITELLTGLPKCLLPVGNVPLIRSCLNSLKNLNVKSTIVIVPENEKLRIQEAIDPNADSKIEFVGIPANEDWGTADSLRMVHDKIKHSVLILSCDLVSTFDLYKMAIQHRKHDADFTMLLTTLPKNMKGAAVPGQKGKNKPEKDIVGMDENGRIIFFNSEADCEEGVNLRMSILARHPCFRVCSNLLDAHVYMMKKPLVDFIVSSKNISTLKGEFLPVIISRQFYNNPLPDIVASSNKKESSDIDFKKLALQLASFKNQTGLFDDECDNQLKCYAYVEREALCLRANTLVGYMEICRQIGKNMEAAMGVSRKFHAFPKSQVDNDSILGEDVQLLTKSSVKQSIIGNNCSFSEKVKVAGSVVMDCVNIQSGSSLSGCIVCKNASIGSNCELKNCIVAPDQEISDGTKLVNEVVQGAYQLMEI